MDTRTTVRRLMEADDAYESGRPVMTDFQYDRLRGALRREEPDHPYLRSVGGATKRGRRESLPAPMGSLDKLRPGDVGPWMKKLEEQHGPQQGWLVEPKFDGQSVLLRYDGGKLVAAWTRGRRVDETGTNVGQNVTNNAKYVQGVRPYLSKVKLFDTTRESVLVRGEVVMHDSIFAEHYAKREADATTHEGSLVKTYKNPRNLCAGLLGRLDLNDETKRDLSRCTFVALQAFRQIRGKWVRPGNSHTEWVALQLMGFTIALNPVRYAPGHAKIAKLVREGHTGLRRLLPVIPATGGIGGELAYWDHRPTAAEVVERLSAMRKAVDVRLDGLVVQPLHIAPWVRAGDHLAARPRS